MEGDKGDGMGYGEGRAGGEEGELMVMGWERGRGMVEGVKGDRMGYG